MSNTPQRPVYSVVARRENTMLSYCLLPRVLVATPETAQVMSEHLAQQAQVMIVDVQVAQDDHVVLAAAVVAHRAKHVGQCVELLVAFRPDRCECRPART